MKRSRPDGDDEPTQEQLNNAMFIVAVEELEEYPIVAAFRSDFMRKLRRYIPEKYKTTQGVTIKDLTSELFKWDVATAADQAYDNW